VCTVHGAQYTVHGAHCLKITWIGSTLVSQLNIQIFICNMGIQCKIEIKDTHVDLNYTFQPNFNITDRNIKQQF
jgi:hypothetical protein